MENTLENKMENEVRMNQNFSQVNTTLKRTCTYVFMCVGRIPRISFHEGSVLTPQAEDGTTFSTHFLESIL
jgi:hypothetical protein